MAYDDDRYQVEKTFVCPIEVDVTASSGEVADLDLSENIEVTEIGFMVSTQTSYGSGESAAVSLLDGTGGSDTVTLSIPSGKSASDYVKSSVSNEAHDSGETLVFNHKTQAAGSGSTGKGYIVIKYKEHWK